MYKDKYIYSRYKGVYRINGVRLPLIAQCTLGKLSHDPPVCSLKISNLALASILNGQKEVK